MMNSEERSAARLAPVRTTAVVMVVAGVGVLVNGAVNGGAFAVASAAAGLACAAAGAWTALRAPAIAARRVARDRHD